MKMEDFKHDVRIEDDKQRSQRQIIISVNGLDIDVLIDNSGISVDIRNGISGEELERCSHDF